MPTPSLLSRLHRFHGRELPLIGAFAALGWYSGTWAATLPSTASAAGASAGQLGLCLFVASLLSLPVMYLAGSLVDRDDRLGSPISLLAFALLIPLAGRVNSLVELAAVMMLLAGAAKLLNISMNAGVQALESHGPKRMGIAHATYSIGMLAGGITTSLAFTQGAGRAFVLDLAGAVALAIAAWNAWTGLKYGRLATSVTELTPDAMSKPRSSVWQRLQARRHGELVSISELVGVAVALELAIEIAVATWSALHLRHSLHVTAGVAALAPATFALAMIVGRVRQRHAIQSADPFDGIIFGTLLTGFGIALLAVAPSWWGALIGCALAGYGAATISPTLFTWACRSGGEDRRGRALATASSIGWFGGLLGPSGIGLIAQLAGIRPAIGVLALLTLPLAAVAARLATRTAPNPTASLAAARVAV